MPARSFFPESFVCVGAFIQRARWRIKAISKQSLLLAEFEAINLSSNSVLQGTTQRATTDGAAGGSLGGKHLGEGSGLKREELTHNQCQYLTHFDCYYLPVTQNFSPSLMFMEYARFEINLCLCCVTLFHWLLCLFVEYKCLIYLMNTFF